MKLSRILFISFGFYLFNNFQEDLLINVEKKEIIIDEKETKITESELIQNLSEFFSKSFNEKDIDKIKEEIKYSINFIRNVTLDAINNSGNSFPVMMKNMRDADIINQLNQIDSIEGSIEDHILKTFSLEMMLSGINSSINQQIEATLNMSLEDLEKKYKSEKNDFLKSTITKFIIEAKKENISEKLEELKTNIINYSKIYFSILYSEEYFKEFLNAQIKLTEKFIKVLKKELKLRKKKLLKNNI